MLHPHGRHLFLAALLVASPLAVSGDASSREAGDDEDRFFADADRDADHPEPRPEAEREDRATRREWLKRARAYPANEVPELAYANAHAAWSAVKARAAVARQHAKKHPQPGPPDPKTLAWKSIGPSPIDVSKGPMETPNMGPVTGRAAALAIDPTNSSTLYAGYAMGGLWKSTDAGATWKPLTDELATLAIGAVAIDPASPNTIYLGTGEPALFAGFLGHGIFKSTDGGQTFDKLGGTDFDDLVISRIVIDGANIYVAAVFGEAGRGESCTNTYKAKPGGVFESTDGGKTWELLKAGDMVDLEVDPNTTPRHIFASDVYKGGFRSIDGGATWATPMGVPTGQYQRVEFALTAADPTVVYAGAGDANGGTMLLVSTDGGATFLPHPTPPNYCPGQCYWDNSVIVDPTDANRVYTGGSLCGIWGTADGLAADPAWTNLSALNHDCGKQFENWYLGSVHPDVHNLTIDPKNASIVYGSTDGGIVRTKDQGQTWERLVTGVGTVQLYGLCLDPSDPEIVYGGAQDNGSFMRTKDTTVWTGIVTGDGGPCAVDPENTKTVLITNDAGVIFRTTTAFKTLGFTEVFSADPNSCIPGMGGCGDRSSFIMPLAGDPKRSGNFYAGTFRIWKNDQGGATKSWKAISPDLTLGKGNLKCTTGGNGDDTLTAVVVAPSDGNTIYTGSAGGVVSVTQDGMTWKKINHAPLPDRWVSSIAVDPVSASTVYVAFSGFSANTPGAAGHVFKSTDAGGTWTPIDTPGDIPVDSIVAHPVGTDLVYAGTDYGVLVTNDGGKSWDVLGDAFPNVAVFSLAFHEKAMRLVAGTHGRSAWSVDFKPGTLAAAPGDLSFEMTIGDPDPAAQTVTVKQDETFGSIIQYAVAADQPWVTGFAMNGAAAGATGTPVSVGITSAGLSAGDFDANVTVTPTAPAGAPITVKVHLKINDAMTNPPPPPPPAADDSGCGCRLSGDRDETPIPLSLVFFAGTVALAFARRRS